MARMTRGGGVAAPDPALEAKRAILWLQALQRVRSAPDGTASAGTLARLHAGPGGGVAGLQQLLGNRQGAIRDLTPGAGLHVQGARALDDTSVTSLMASLAALRKRLGTSAAPRYTQPF